MRYQERVAKEMVSVRSSHLDRVESVQQVSACFVAVEKLCTATVREHNYSLCFTKSSCIMAMSVRRIPHDDGSAMPLRVFVLLFPN
jgi:hypothetical protein